jgi:acetylornithine/N-succinyldiaminopimelate aminotransferase
MGAYIKSGLQKIPQLQNIRGKGLMIGFDVPEELKDLRKNLLFNQHIFTGEAKSNTIRLLPSLALRRKDADEFLEAIEEEINNMVPSLKPVN